MNYAIQQLENQSRIFKNDVYLNDDYLSLQKTKNFLTGGCKSEPTKYGYDYLSDLKECISRGLKGWGNNFEKEKQRQIKKLKQVNEALYKIDVFFNKNGLKCNFCGERTKVFAEVKCEILCRECA